MSVITNVEAKSVQGRLFRFIVFFLLVLGSVTMVFPFLLMLSGALRSEMDSASMTVVPRFLVEDDTLVRKFLETKYNHNVTHMNMIRGYQDYSFQLATVPETLRPGTIKDLRDFTERQEVPDHWWVLGGTMTYKRVVPRNLYLFVDRVKEAYHEDLNELAQDLGAPLVKWRYIDFKMPEWTDPRYGYEPTQYFNAYKELLKDRPLAERFFVSISGRFLQNFVASEYGLDEVDEYNAAHVRKIRDYRYFSLPQRVPEPDEPTLRKEWIAFVQNALNPSFIRADVQPRQYQNFLEEKYRNVATLNDRWQQSFQSFADVPLPEDREWLAGTRLQDYQEFYLTLPVESLRLVGPEYEFRKFLQQKHGTLQALNAAWESDFQSWQEAYIPVDQIELEYVRQNKSSLLWNYATRNFKNVFDEIILQGRPFLNTLIFVALSIALALFLMPLAAYGLSRFNPPGTWRIILLFMATMAFPPMVGMIPQFLMLRQFNLLNTFIALILPVVVNGYLIFLLKGFFDSLPQHLYEAACIDGASEMRMFFEITMALSKPILAVVMLQTFNIAWIMFMYPLIVCPKEEMYVLAVWLFQFQEEASTPAVYASILITSIPTLLIFLFTQRTIMKGIAVPAEK